MVRTGTNHDASLNTYRVSIRYNHSILDVNIHVTIGDFQSIDKLANVDVGNARVLVGVRVLTNLVRRVDRRLPHQDIVDEETSDLHRIHRGVRRSESVGLNLVGAGPEDRMGVFWSETKRLAPISSALVV